MRSQADDTNGAVNACAEAALGALRRTTRLVERAPVLAQPPTAALPEAGGDDARLQAAYRFCAPDASAPQDVLASPIASPSSRLAQVPLGLAVQETTAVDWTGPPATTGWGPLGQTAGQGLHVQSTLAFPPARLPLGLLAPSVWARDPDAMGQRTRRQPWPMGQQESQQWLTSLEAVCRAPAWGPQTRLVRLGEREAEVSDLRAPARPEGVEVLLRASWDRGVPAPERAVWATVAAQAVVERRRVQGPRHGPHPGRDATLGRRFCPLTRRPPQPRHSEGLPAVAWWAVQVRAVEPPDGGEPLAWRLVTTVAVQTGDDAIERVAWYAGRWGLAVGQRMVQRGWRSAARQLATGERLPRCLPR